MPDRTLFAPSVSVLTEQPANLTPPDLSLAGILGRFPALAEAVAVGMTGSTAAGYGNVYSDIDLYVFADETPDLPDDETSETWTEGDAKTGLRNFTWMGRYGDSRVDLKVWPVEAPRVALASFLTDPEPEFCEVSGTVTDFIYRLSIARALTNGEYLSDARQLIASSAYARVLARTQKGLVENKLIDIAGQLDAGDVLSARLSAVGAAAGIAECALIMAGALGQGSKGSKWLLRRLAATPGCGITAEEYCTVVLDGRRDAESDAEYALRVAHWVRDKLIAIEPGILG